MLDQHVSSPRKMTDNNEWIISPDRQAELDEMYDEYVNGPAGEPMDISDHHAIKDGDDQERSHRKTRKSTVSPNYAFGVSDHYYRLTGNFNGSCCHYQRHLHDGEPRGKFVPHAEADEVAHIGSTYCRQFATCRPGLRENYRLQRSSSSISIVLGEHE